MRRLIILIDRTIDRLFLILFIFIFLVGLYFSYDMWYVFGHARDDSLLRYKPTEKEAVDLRKLSKDAIGWITIADTGIDYPIMQGDDNMEYLNKDPYGAFSLSGSIFLDTRNHQAFTDAYSLIYGHHMEYGVMFGALDRYLDEAFFAGHQEGLLIAGRTRYPLHIFAAVKTDAAEDLIFNPTLEEPEKLLAYIKEQAAIYEEPMGTRLVGLSTCADPSTTDRWVVFGYLGEENEQETTE